ATPVGLVKTRPTLHHYITDFSRIQRHQRWTRPEIRTRRRGYESGRHSATRKLTNSRAAAECCSPRRVRTPEWIGLIWFPRLRIPTRRALVTTPERISGTI